MKILFIPSWYPSKSNPIWGSYLIKQAESMSNYADVSMIYVDRVGLKKVFSLFKRENDEKYRFKFYKSKILSVKRLNLNLSYEMYKKAIYKLYKIYEKENGKPDIIFAQSVLPAGLGALYISEKENIPFVVHEHSTQVMKQYEKHSNIVIGKANGYYAVSNNVKDFLKKRNRKDTIVIPNYIDTKRFSYKPNKSKDKFILINICNFFKVKSLDTLLKALRIVIDKYKIKNIELNIIGTGEYESFYKGICKDLNLNNYVSFKGFIDNNKLPNIISSSNVLCVSSKLETFCIPIVEAMSCGLPCISTKCGGPEEIINESNGLLVPVDNPEEYAKAIVYMYNNINKYDPKIIRKYVNSRYDKEVVCKKLLKELEIVIKKSGIK